MKHLLKEAWTFVLLLSSLIWFLGLPSVFVTEVCLCVFASRGPSLYSPASLFVVVIIFRLSLFALRLKIWCPDLQRAFFFRPHPRLSLRTSPQRRPLEPQLATGSMTKSVQGEGEIRGRSHLLWGAEKEKEKKQKGRGKKSEKSPGGGWNTFTAADVFPTLVCAKRAHLPLEVDGNGCTKSSA